MADLGATRPGVGVVIPAYNVGPWVGQALDSVLDQRLDEPINIVIAEDCSTDDTRAVCRAYADEHPDTITLLTRDHNVGLEQNAWEAFNLVDNEFVINLDGDDYWTDPDKLAIQIQALRDDPDAVACAHNAWRIEPDGTRIGLVHPEPLERSTYDITDFVTGSAWFPAFSLLYRNIFRGAYPSVLARKGYGAEVMRTMVHAEHGHVTYIHEPMGAWRIHDSGRWNGLSGVERSDQFLDLIPNWDRALGGRYHDEFMDRLWKRVVRDARRRRDLVSHPRFAARLSAAAVRCMAHRTKRRITAR